MKRESSSGLEKVGLLPWIFPGERRKAQVAAFREWSRLPLLLSFSLLLFRLPLFVPFSFSQATACFFSSFSLTPFPLSSLPLLLPLSLSLCLAFCLSAQTSWPPFLASSTQGQRVRERERVFSSARNMLHSDDTPSAKPS